MSDYLDTYNSAIVSQILENKEYELEEIELPEFDLIHSTESAGAQALGNSRFQSISYADIDTFLEQNQNINTKQKTQSNVSLFKSYLENRGEYRNIENLSAKELNEQFSTFLLSVKKRDGTEYEPSTFKGFMCSIDRYLKEKDSKFRLSSGSEFEKCVRVLEANQKQLKCMGLGNKSNASDELTDADIDKLYENKLLGVHAPLPLVNLLHLTFSLHFGMIGGKEQKDLKLGDISIGKDSTGHEFLYHKKERQTKTRQGQNPNDLRKAKAWAHID